MMNLTRIYQLGFGLLLALSMVGCLPESAGSGAPSFEVIGIGEDGQDDIPRNHAIQVVFTEPVRYVNDDTIHLVSGPDYNQKVPVQFRINGRTATILTDKVVPTGLRPSTDYLLQIPGFPKANTVRSQSEESLLETYVARFRTMAGYGRDVELPQVLGDASTRPIRASSDVFVEFSEAMDPRILAHETISLRDERNESVMGRFHFNASLTKMSFVPEHEPLAGNSFTLTLDPGMTDLAQNRLAGPFLFNFEMESGASIRSVDLAHPVEMYHSEEIETSPDGSGIRVRSTPFSSFTPEPATVDPRDGLWTASGGRRIQYLFTPEEIGDAGEIHRLYFETRTRPDQTTLFEGAEIRLWHSDREELSTRFRENYPDGSVDEHYFPFLSIPAQDAQGFFTVPLRRPFHYNGLDNLILEVTHFGGTDEVEASGHRSRSSSIVRVSGLPSEVTGHPTEILDDIRFGKMDRNRFVEFNGFVDLGEFANLASRPVLVGNVPYVDDYVLILVEGADQVNSDGRATGPTTGLQRKLASVADSRYLRFRIYLLKEMLDDDQPIELTRLDFPVRQ